MLLSNVRQHLQWNCRFLSKSIGPRLRQAIAKTRGIKNVKHGSFGPEIKN